MREQVVELRPHLQNSCGRALLDHFFRNDLNQGFPVWWRYWCLLCNLVAVKRPVSLRISLASSLQVSLLLRMHRLVHQECPSQVPAALFRYSLFQSSVGFQALFLSHTLQYGLNLLYARRRNSD